MSEPVFTLKAFASYCEKRGDAEYNWYSSTKCACAQYAEHFGVWQQWMDTDLHDGSFFDIADGIAMDKPHTFLALAIRLRERMANESA